MRMLANHLHFNQLHVVWNVPPLSCRVQWFFIGRLANAGIVILLLFVMVAVWA
jgi:hypothetical protein